MINANFLFFSAILVALGTQGADLLTLDGREYAVVKQARQDTYNLTFDFARTPGQAFTTVDIAFSIQSGAAYARFSCDSARYVLEQRTPGGIVLLAAGEMGLWQEFQESGHLVLKRRRHSFEVIAGERRLFRILTEGLGQGHVAVATGPGVAQADEVSYQRIEPIVHGDDFMRTEEEAQDLGLWEALRGDWKVYSVLDEIRANPDARIREGREPAADRSPNPFCLSGSSPKEAVILTGMPFWDDYELNVSVKTMGGSFGVVFGVTSPDTFWYVRWTLTSLGVRARKLELVRRHDGKDQVVASTIAEGRAVNWYRLGVRTIGSRIDVVLDNRRLIRVWSDESIGGRIGLYAAGDRETLFDDVELKSIRAISFDDERLLTHLGEVIEGNWDLRGSTGHLMFATSNRKSFGRAGDCMYALGLETWPRQCFQAQIAPQDAGVSAFGLVFAMKSSASYWRVIWQNDELILSTFRNGIEHVVATSSDRRDDGALTTMTVDLREKGLVQIRVDDLLHFRVATEEDLSGRTGLYARSKREVIFRRVTAFAEPQRDWEQPVNIERFADDPFMQGWASPRYAWIRLPGEEGETFPQIFVHKGDFYGAFRFDLPCDNGIEIRFGNDDPTEQELYCAKICIAEAEKPQGKITLSRDGKMVAETSFAPLPLKIIEGQQIVDEKIGALPKTPDTRSYGNLRLERDGKQIWFSFEDKEILHFTDDHPLTGRAMAMRIPQKLDFVTVSVVRDHLKDYLFEKAAVDWVNVGTWEVTNRFACDPRWSHMNGRSKGTATLWNKFEFEGDYTVEYYAGMRMRQGDMMEGAAKMYYPRVGDINLALSARDRDLFSGADVILAAWDPMWTETWTQFWYKGKVIERNDRELIPRGRIARPRTRAIEVDWDPGGRPVHGAWYFLKVRKTGRRFDVLFDNVPVFSTKCPGDLIGRRIALWTQHNSIVLARAKIGYTQCHVPALTNVPESLPSGLVRSADIGPAPSSGADRPGPQKVSVSAIPSHFSGSRTDKALPRPVSVSHPSFCADFETGLDGFVPFSGDQSAELSLDATRDTGKALRLENLYGGGDFGVLLPTGLIDLGRVSRLSLDAKFSEDTKVNLYITFADTPKEHAFFTLTGPDNTSVTMTHLGEADGVRDNGRWTHIDLDIARAVRRAFPWRSNYYSKEVMIGMLHEGYLNSGHKGNPEGATYWIDNVEVVSSGTGQFHVTWEQLDETALPGIQAVVASEEQIPDFPEDGPVLQQPDYEITVPSTGDYRLWYRFRMDGKSWSEPKTFPFRVEAPLTLTLVKPEKAESWSGGPIIFKAASTDSAILDLATTTVTLNGETVQVNEATTQYNPDNGTLQLTPEFQPGTGLNDGAECNLTVTWRDSRGTTPVPSIVRVLEEAEAAEKAGATKEEAGAGEKKEEEKAPEPEPDQRTEQTFSLALKLDYAADSVPPTRVVLNPVLYPLLDFDHGLQGTAPFSVNSNVKLSLPQSNVPAKGRSLRIDNILCGSEFGVRFDIGDIALGKFPVLAFDYRTDTYSRSDFLLQVLGQKYTIGFTDNDPQNTLEVARADDVKADGKWQHAEISLGNALQQSNKKGWGQPPTVSRFGLGDWGYAGNAPGAWNEIDNIMFVPVVSTTQELKLTWSASDAAGIADYSLVWDTFPDTQPDDVPETTEAEMAWNDLPEGENWFHIKARDRAGNWGPASHWRFLIDNTAPRVAEVTPTGGSLAAADSVNITLEKGLADIDIANVKMTLNGRQCRLNASSVNWDPEELTLKWDMLTDWNFLRRELGDGTEMKVTLSGVEDFAGNTGEEYSWSWKVDYSQDHTPPGPPALWSYTHNFRNFDHFTGTAGHWRPYNGRNTNTTSVTSVKDPDTDDDCLEIRKAEKGRRFGASRYRGKLSLDRFPLLSFDYKIMPDTKVNLLLYINKTWHAVRMTGGDALPIVGEISEAKADGTWRHALIDLDQMLKEGLPKAKGHEPDAKADGEKNDGEKEEQDINLQLVAFGEWSGDNPVGATIYIDNFAYMGPSCPLPLFSYSSADATGISEYKLAFDMNRDTIPSTTVPVSRTQDTLTAADKPGIWYIHARARDGAGNWGITIHHPYYCTEFVPPEDPDGFETGEQWLFDPKQRTRGYAYDAKTGKNNRIAGFQLIGGKKESSARVHRRVEMRVPRDATIQANLFVDANDPVEIKAVVRTAKGLKWLSSDTLTVEPGAWHKDLTFTFSVPKGKAAASEAAAKVSIRDIGFMFTGTRRTRDVVLLDDLRVNGKRTL